MSIQSEIDNLNLEEVLKFAENKHAGQKRADGSPYITHPIRVAELIRKYRINANNKILIAGALLHDVLEDTYTSPREINDWFGSEVGSLVLELTNAAYACKMMGKDKYLSKKMLIMTDEALIIKLADRYDNISDLAGVAPERREKMIVDTIHIINTLQIERDLTKTQKLFVEMLKGKIDQITQNPNNFNPIKLAEEMSKPRDIENTFKD